MNKNKKNSTGMNEQEKQVKWPVILRTILIILIAYVIVAGIFVYFFNTNNPILYKTERTIPYPAAFVGLKIITIGELKDELNSVRMFYENQDFSDMGLRVDFSTPDGKKRLEVKEKNILNKLIENKVVETEANRRGINLTSAMVSQEVNTKLQQYGTQNDVGATLKNLYGWTITDFENKIVKPDLYEEKLFENIQANDKSFMDAKNKIQNAQKELQSGTDFESVVAKYSEGDSVKNRGELGWFDASEMLPEISQVVFTMDKGNTSNIIESSLGYHIVNVEDKKTENGVDEVRLRQIFVRSQNFDDWLCDQEKKDKIYIISRDYVWNHDNCSVEFRSNDMKDFENNLMNNSPDDPSVMF